MFDQAYLETTLMKPVTETRSRVLKFAGAKNFRDLGGYRTEDGRALRWGLLYRSDGLHRLTHADLKALAALNLYTVVDFRSEHETAREPDRLPLGMGIRHVKIPILDHSTKIWRQSHAEFIKNIKSINPAHDMIKANMEFATKFTDEVKLFFREVLSAEGRPILFHCAVGKDHTGFIAAVLLLLLGVPREHVLKDYLLTNDFLLPAFQRELTVLRILRGRHYAAVVNGFMEARAEYLNAGLDTIDREFGSFANYLTAGLRLEKSLVEKLRTVYLE
jgi:protein-tyrosine phosphatase